MLAAAVALWFIASLPLAWGEASVGNPIARCSGQAGCLPAGPELKARSDWPTFHFSEDRAGLNPYEHVIGPGNVGSLVQAWRFAAPGPIAAAPSVVSGLVYVQTARASAGLLYALDSRTGTVLWRQKQRQPGGAYSEGATVADGKVFIGTDLDHSVHVYDAATGATAWSYLATGPVSIPAVVNGFVYVGVSTVAGTKAVVALDEATGALRWTAKIHAGVDSSPSVASGQVLVGGYDDKVHAYDAVTGTLRWTFKTGDVVHGTVAVAGGVAYVGSSDHRLYALRVRDGSLLWSTKTGGAVESTPAVAGGMVYVGSDDGLLYAMHGADGSVAWTAPVGTAALFSSPIVANGVVYTGGVGLHAFDAGTGALLWSALPGVYINFSQAVVGGTLYVDTLDDAAYAFRLPASPAQPR